MDIWETLYLEAKQHYNPHEVNPFMYTNHVVCALETESGKIFSSFCMETTCGTMNLCAERMAALKMYTESGETTIKRLIAFRDAPPSGNGGMPCGVCQEFLLQLSVDNRHMEIMVDFGTRETITLDELHPKWWGYERLKQES